MHRKALAPVLLTRPDLRLNVVQPVVNHGVLLEHASASRVCSNRPCLPCVTALRMPGWLLINNDGGFATGGDVFVYLRRRRWG
jgi:hypothetical protein